MKTQQLPHSIQHSKACKFLMNLNIYTYMYTKKTINEYLQKTNNLMYKL